jgi:small subunit ribosomal protein S17
MTTKQGIITSAKMQGTVTVTVHESSLHPVYRKRFRRSKNFLADSAGHDLAEGDLVLITECRPLSKRKHFRVTEIVQKAANVSELSEEKDLASTLHREKKTAETPVASPSAE